MKWTPWFQGVHYAYRQAGNGAFVELGYVPNGELVEPTVFLQGDDATAFIDEIERLEANEHIIFVVGLENALDDAISAYFV